MTALSITCWAMIGLFNLVVFFLKEISLARNFSIFFLMITLAAGTDVLKLRHLTALKERALFYYWLSVVRSYKVGFGVWLVLLLAMGGIQWQLQQAIGDQEIMLRAWGGIYADIREGELWRLVTGPFFHARFIHYFSNVFFALLIGPIVWAVLGTRSLLIFLFGNAVGALAQTYLDWGQYDSFVGISGGLYWPC